MDRSNFISSEMPQPDRVNGKSASIDPAQDTAQDFLQQPDQKQPNLEHRSPQASVRIAIVGDIHDQWELADELALKHLGVDLVLFVGDFGNESVSIVQQIAQLDLPKATIFGNHDAWYTATNWGRLKCPYDRSKEDRVQQQIDWLGDTQVGYGKLDLPQFSFSVVGGRPFSWGGSEWRNRSFYRDRYGVTNFAESVQRIISAANSATSDTLIFLGHNGPFGLGAAPEDPCGRDWQPMGGDFGDPDLAEAIATLRHQGKTIPLVTFGHMHHALRHTKQRLRKLTDFIDNTLYLNAASVPRIRQDSGNTRRNFSIVTLEAGSITQASLIWIDQNLQIQTEQVLYQPSGLSVVS